MNAPIFLSFFFDESFRKNMSPSGLGFYRPSFVEPIYQKLSVLVADFSEAGDGLSSLVRQGEALQRGRRVLQLSQL